MKIKNLLALALLCLISAACSNKAETIEDKLKDYVSDDATLVVAGDLSRALNATDFTVNEETGELETPSYLGKLINDVLDRSDRKALNQILEIKGFDWTNTVMAMKLGVKDNDLKKAELMIIFSVKDDDELAESLENLDGAKFEKGKEGDFITVGNKEATILIDGKVGYFCVAKKGPCKAGASADMIEQWRKDAKEKPLAEWKVNYLKQQHILNALMGMKEPMEAAISEARNMPASVIEMMNKYKDSYMGLTFDIADQTTSLTFQAFDKSGKDLVAPGIKNIDTDMVQYATADDVVAAALGIGDIQQYVNGLAQEARLSSEETAIAQQVAKVFTNATVFAAAGPTDGFGSLNRPSVKNWHFVGAVKFETNNKAALAYSLMEKYMGLQGDSTGNAVINYPYSYEYDYYTGYYQTLTIPVYVQRNGDTIVISNGTRKGGSQFKSADFKGKNMAVVANLDKNSALLSQLNMPFGINAMLTVTAGSKVNCDVKLTGGKGKFIEQIVNLVVSGEFGKGAPSRDYTYDEEPDSVKASYAYETPAKMTE